MQIERSPIFAEIVEKLKRQYRPIKVILYGSYARHEEHEDSDIDLLIIAVTRERPLNRFVEVKRILYDPKNRIPISPLILTPEEIASRLDSGDDFISDILAEGEILYATTRPFAGRSSQFNNTSK
ncbi:MAG TPA: nucleotidyltransferase domain-containing protein [Candidatus Lokiarchaeia archaeon]|nr:nucleotidyltransferase domain-containing protein [Candidatus Lokiarchaeia archaeon]